MASLGPEAWNTPRTGDGPPGRLLLILGLGCLLAGAGFALAEIVWQVAR